MTNPNRNNNTSFKQDASANSATTPSISSPLPSDSLIDMILLGAAAQETNMPFLPQPPRMTQHILLPTTPSFYTWMDERQEQHQNLQDILSTAIDIMEQEEAVPMLLHRGRHSSRGALLESRRSRFLKDSKKQ
ncbi:unnamed protein product [Cylindrotheca closterium]|uniref:Uncharacterized protein n=1 Tax=Cylindrotheca closterium TaxID=2856 RepID=A0AAD2GAY7_9STRA|nr:unnamed protein product [Cylindrotheca closterium]